MKPLLPVLLSLVFALHAGAGDPPLSDPSVGTTDAEGDLIIHVFPAEDKPRPVYLSSAYGVVMCRTNDSCCFVLADRAKKSVREFSSYNHYLDALATLPKGSTLHIYDRCQMPMFYDFYPVHQELYKKFAVDCRKRGLKIAKETRITCTCELPLEK